jgi:hypothetical protein
MSCSLTHCVAINIISKEGRTHHIQVVRREISRVLVACNICVLQPVVAPVTARAASFLII